MKVSNLSEEDRRWLRAALQITVDEHRERMRYCGKRSIRYEQEIHAKMEGLLSDVQDGCVTLDPYADNYALGSFDKTLRTCAKFLRTSCNPEGERQARFYDALVERLREFELNYEDYLATQSPLRP